MAVVKPVILQVVGYKNSGKTTVLTRLIEKLTRAHLQVVTIKHHGHPGKLHIPRQNDSSRHLNAGALAAIVAGEDDLLLQAAGRAWSLAEKLQLACLFKTDIVLIEGHKQAQFPKVLLIRDSVGMELITRLCRIEAVIVWDAKLQKEASQRINVPVFLLQEDDWLNWITGLLAGRVSET